MNKKGESMGQMVMLTVGLGVAILALIFMGTLGGTAYNLVEPDLDTMGTFTATNDQITVLNSTNRPLSNQHLLANPTATKAGVVIAGNFTYNLEAGTVYLKDIANNNTAINFTYTYRNTTVSDSAKRGIISAFNAQEDTAGLMPVIVLAVIISMVLMYVLGFGMRGKMGGNGDNMAL